jgi:hypothetical protein
MAPFEIMYGFCPDFTVLVGPPTKFPALDTRLQQLHESCKEAEAALRDQKRSMKETFEKVKPSPHTFTPGQKVWLNAKDISLTSPSRKLAVRQLGPYQVIECTGELMYSVALPFPQPCDSTQCSMSIVYPHGKVSSQMSRDITK